MAPADGGINSPGPFDNSTPSSSSPTSPGFPASATQSQFKAESNLIDYQHPSSLRRQYKQSRNPYLQDDSHPQLPREQQQLQSEKAENFPQQQQQQQQHLTEEQKKANHIASEKKRRLNIREQYDKLADMTPNMKGQGRSEGKVLEEVVRMGKRLKLERELLIAQIEAEGGKVPPELKNF